MTGLLLAIQAILAAAPSMADFTGNWETTYGPLVLNQDENGVVDGYYTLGGLCTVRGRIDPSGRLVFEYTEPEASGEGWFALSGDGNSFSGEWRARGSSTWSAWEGYRSGSGAGGRWLVILETEWQEGLGEPEYSFGDMLEAWFSRVQGVQVRQRFIHDARDFDLFCGEIAMLPGTVYLLISSHASEEGISLADGSLGSQEIIEGLRPCRNLALVHFSTCLVMAGSIPHRLAASRSDWPDGFVISGYTKSVDWGMSGVLEIAYLDFILEDGMSPAEACSALVGSVDFAGQNDGRFVEAAGFDWLEP